MSVAPQKFEEMQEELQAMATKFNFGVAIDGSYMSQQALDLVCKLINESNAGRPKLHKVHCLHVENPEKQEALSLQSAHFKHSATLRIERETHIEMKWVQKHLDVLKFKAETSAGIFSLLEGMAKDNRIDVLVVGTFGLNGEKKDRIGRTSSFSMANSAIPVFIVKPTFLQSQTSGNPRKFLIAVEGKTASYKAMLFVLRYLVRPDKDVVHLFYKNTAKDAEGFFDPYIALLDDMKVEHDAIFSEDRELNVAAEIVKKASDLECEFIVLGKKRTRSRAMIGSITDYVAARSKSSIIICKDSRF